MRLERHVATASRSPPRTPSPAKFWGFHPLRKLRCDANSLLHMEIKESETGLFTARWKSGHTVVLARAAGPRSLPVRRENASRCSLFVTLLPTSGQSKLLDGVVASALSGALGAVICAGFNPRTGVTVSTQVLRDDGGVVAAALNAAVCALLSSGVPMRCILAATSVSISHAGGLQLHPTTEEEASAAGCLTFAFRIGDDCSSRGCVLAMLTAGHASAEHTMAAMDAARLAVAATAKEIRQAVAQRIGT